MGYLGGGPTRDVKARRCQSNQVYVRVLFALLFAFAILIMTQSSLKGTRECAIRRTRRIGNNYRIDLNNGPDLSFRLRAEARLEAFASGANKY